MMVRECTGTRYVLFWVVEVTSAAVGCDFRSG
jgi:hypothetical protein